MEEAFLGISERLRSLIKDRFASLREFADAAGVPYRSVQQYTSGAQLPGAAALATMATTLGVSLDHIVLGMPLRGLDGGLGGGTTQLGVGIAKATAALKARPTGNRTDGMLPLSVEQEVLDLWGSEPSGIWALARRALLFLASAHPRQCGWSEVWEAVGRPQPNQLLAALMVLITSNLATRTKGDGEPLYYVPSPALEMVSRDEWAAAEVARQAIDEILTVILPAVSAEPQRGYLVASKAAVPRAAAFALVDRILEANRELWMQAAAEAGPTSDEVTLVIGIARRGVGEPADS